MDEELHRAKTTFKISDRSDHCAICGRQEVEQRLSCEVMHPFPAIYLSGRCAKHQLTTGQLADKSCIFKIYFGTDTEG